MRVLQINQSDVTGGAAIAAYRLHQGLLRQGIGSKLLVGHVTQTDALVAPTPPQPLRKKLKNLEEWLGLRYITYWSTQAIAQHPFYQEADVLHFHNLHGGYFNYLFLPYLTRNKPAVYTLHDMWGFTGHCSYSLLCYYGIQTIKMRGQRDAYTFLRFTAKNCSCIQSFPLLWGTVATFGKPICKRRRINQ
jgi:hypothetical protein